MSRTQGTFLIKQTLIAVLLNGMFSVVAVFLVFRHIEVVPLSGSPSLIADSILQTFIATLMSILPPSIMTAKWMLTKPDLTAATPSRHRILIRAFSAALCAGLISFIVLPLAMHRLFTACVSFWSMLLPKCLYGMAIGLVVTPFAVTAVLRGPHRGAGTATSIEQE